MNQELIFNIHFDHSSYAGSASALRPKKMKEAFESLGWKIESVEGDFSSRQEKAKSLINRINEGYRPAFYYAESSTTPHSLANHWKLPRKSYELSLMKTCKENDIPTALFYRDMHWRFNLQSSLLGKAIIAYYKPFYQKEWKAYSSLADIVYLPSESMASALPSKPKEYRALPPGGVESVQSEKRNDHTAIYVGGITDSKGLYDLSPVLESLENTTWNLDLICRLNDWSKCSQFYAHLLGDSIHLHHLEGDELSLYLSRASIAFQYFPDEPYRNFAFPYKVMEYMFHGLPIVANSGTIVSDFIKANNIGWVVQDKKELKELLVKLTKEPSIIELKRKAIKDLLPNHTWKARAMQVIEELT